MARFRGVSPGALVGNFFNNIKHNWELDEIWDALPGRLNPHRAEEDERDVFNKWGLDFVSALSHLSNLTLTKEKHETIVRQMGVRIDVRRRSRTLPQQQWIVLDDVERLIKRNGPAPDGVLPQGAYRGAPMPRNAGQAPVAQPAPDAGQAGNTQAAANNGQAGDAQAAPNVGQGGNAQPTPNPGPAANSRGSGNRRGLARKAKATPKKYIELSDSDMDSDLDSDPDGEEQEERQEEDEPTNAAQHQPDPRNRKRKARHDSSPSTEASASPRKRLRSRRRPSTQASENNTDISVEQVQQEGDGLDGNADHNQEQVQQEDILQQPVDPDDEVLLTVEDVVEHVGVLTFEHRYPLPATATVPNRIAMLKELKKRTQKLRQDRHETGEYKDHEYDYRILIEKDRVERGEDGADADDEEEEVLHAEV